MAGDFTDLIAWQQAVALVADIDELIPKLRRPGARDVADQLRRAAESIPANIAEGYGRGYGREFARFLRIGTGSAVELESHIRVSVAGRRLFEHEAAGALARTRRVRALTRGLYLKVIAMTDERLRREPQDP